MEILRHLCSQMVTLTCTGRSEVVNLEEIWATGAVLECEESVPPGSSAEIGWEGVSFAGRISAAIEHKFGWQVEMEFSPLTPWSPERATPAHLVAFLLEVPDK